MNELKFEDIESLWKHRKNYPNESMHIYLHSPFCVGVCKYCMYNSLEMKDTSKVEYDFYFEGLLSQIKASKEILELNPADSLYFGGGTPSIMPFGVLKDISAIIPHWDNIRVKVFEANPMSLNKRKIDILSELGFTYLSLGVQTLDEKELERQNRKAPKPGHLKEITQYALDKGLHVNYDIMCLLDDDLSKDAERLYKDLNLIMREYNPPSIDVYPMDQKLNNISQSEIFDKIMSVRKSIKKACYFNKDSYHIGAYDNSDRIFNKDDILSHYKRNYHLLNISDAEFRTRKLYSCSGPSTAPENQNVISFGGYKNSWLYSYAANKDFVYYTQLDKDGKVSYIERR